MEETISSGSLPSVAPLSAFDRPEELTSFNSTHLDFIHKTVFQIHSRHFLKFTMKKLIPPLIFPPHPWPSHSSTQNGIQRWMEVVILLVASSSSVLNLSRVINIPQSSMVPLSFLSFYSSQVCGSVRTVFLNMSIHPFCVPEHVIILILSNSYSTSKSKT